MGGDLGGEGGGKGETVMGREGEEGEGFFSWNWWLGGNSGG